MILILKIYLAVGFIFLFLSLYPGRECWSRLRGRGAIYVSGLSVMVVIFWPWFLMKVIKVFRQAKEMRTIKNLYKGQTIAVHVLDEHILPRKPQPLPLGGTTDQWDAYWGKALEIAGAKYNEWDIAEAGYLITKVEEVVDDQVLFRDSNGELRLAPGDEVITKEEAPEAFEIWLSQKSEGEAER